MMTTTRYIAILGLLALGSVASGSKQKLHRDIAHEDLIDLLEKSDTDTILASLQTSEPCRSCSDVASELSQLGDVLASSQFLRDQRTLLATIDCSLKSTARLCSTMEVASYPTMWLFQKGIAEDESVTQSRYRGPRTASAMRTFLTRRSMPEMSHLDTVEAFEEFIEADSNVIIMSGAGQEHDVLSQSIATHQVDELLVGRINGSLSEMLGPSPAALCYKSPQTLTAVAKSVKAKMPWSRLTGDSLKDSSALSAWLDACAQQAIHAFSRRKVQQLYALQRPIAYLFHDGDDAAVHAVHASARRWRDFVSFVQVDAAQQKELLSALELDPNGGLPALSVEGVVNTEVYPMPQDWLIEKDNIDSFLQGILEGKAAGGKAGQTWLDKFGLVGKMKKHPKDEL